MTPDARVKRGFRRIELVVAVCIALVCGVAGAASILRYQGRAMAACPGSGIATVEVTDVDQGIAALKVGCRSEISDQVFETGAHGDLRLAAAVALITKAEHKQWAYLWFGGGLAALVVCVGLLELVSWLISGVPRA